MKKITKREFQRGGLTPDVVPEALILEDRNGVSAILFPISREIFEKFSESFARLEASIQFEILSRRASETGPPMSLEEIQEEIDAYRRGK